MEKLILANKNLKILEEILDFISNLPRVKESIKLQNKTNFYIESIDDGTLYYYLKADCNKGLEEYAKGFCSGYIAGKGFDNSI